MSTADELPAEAWQLRQLVIDRARGRCERCQLMPPGHVHHRRPKGMGGSRRPETERPSNYAALCAGCHTWAHGNPEAARLAGWLVRQGAQPADVPVLLHGRRLVLLTDSGTYEPAAA